MKGELDPRRCAPILLVTELEASRSFWVRELGFEVQHEGAGLCLLDRGGQSLTLWSRAAAHGELGELARDMGDAGCFFVASNGDGRRVLLDPDGHRVVLE